MKTYDEDSEEIRILWALMKYADHNKRFNRKFVDDINDFFEKHNYITNNQMEVLAKIYYKNNVDEFFNKLDQIHEMEPNY